MPGKRLSSEERAQIEVLFGQGFRFGQIAAVIGRDRSTVWREVRRNRTLHRGAGTRGAMHPRGRRPGYVPGQGYPRSWGRAYGWRYSHVVAQRHADERARRPRAGKLRPRWGQPWPPLWEIVRQAGAAVVAGADRPVVAAGAS